MKYSIILACLSSLAIGCSSETKLEVSPNPRDAVVQVPERTPQEKLASVGIAKPEAELLPLLAEMRVELETALLAEYPGKAKKQKLQSGESPGSEPEEGSEDESEGQSEFDKRYCDCVKKKEKEKEEEESEDDVGTESSSSDGEIVEDAPESNENDCATWGDEGQSGADYGCAFAVWCELQWEYFAEFVGEQIGKKIDEGARKACGRLANSVKKKYIPMVKDFGEHIEEIVADGAAEAEEEVREAVGEVTATVKKQVGEAVETSKKALAKAEKDIRDEAARVEKAARDKAKAEAKKAEEEARKKAEALKKKEEELRRKAEEEARKKKEELEAAARKAEEDARNEIQRGLDRIPTPRKPF